MFFLAYFLFEVPSNIILDKVGARRWIARIMLSPGASFPARWPSSPEISQATGISAEHTFYLLRILLGFAEAGFFPGIIFFLTLWFPAAYRARIVGYFMAAIPLSSALGSPVSAALLGLDGAWGLRGWQWLFIVEALPSILLAVVTFFYLTDRPADANWLDEQSRRWLMRRLALEDTRREHVSPASALASLTDYRVLALSLVYFGNVACLYGVSFWLPTIVKGFGVSIAMTGWIAAIPYVVAFLGMVWWGLRSDQKGERTLHLAIALAIAAIGVGGSAFLADPLAKMIALTSGAFGVYAAPPIFWTLPTAFLAGAAVAPGIAAINSIGNLSGYFGPYVMGWIKDATGGFRLGPGDDRRLRGDCAAHHAGARPRRETGARPRGGGMTTGGTSMLTRRTFAVCALCAAGGFLATGVEAEQAPTAGLKRTLLKETDGPTPGFVTVEMKVEIEPGAPIARHTHPGVVSGYVIEGGTELAIDGVGTATLKAGDGYQVPTGVPHMGTNGPAKTVIAATYVVEKGKPLASPA